LNKTIFSKRNFIFGAVLGIAVMFGVDVGITGFLIGAVMAVLSLLVVNILDIMNSMLAVIREHSQLLEDFANIIRTASSVDTEEEKPDD